MNGRRTRKQQIMTMSIIAVAIVTLSIGFAAFSSTLRISSTAAVNPDSGSFSVVFSSNANTLETNAIAANPSTYGDSATIENGTVPTISGLNAKFTSPGQTVTYTFYALNEGAYLAYLNYINFNNVEGASSNIVCEAGEVTSADLVTQACSGISISVKVGSDAAVSTSQSGISNHTLSAGSSETVIVTITYNTGSAVADGPFNVIFGDIELIYSSALNGGSSGTDTPTTPTTPVTPICTAVTEENAAKFESEPYFDESTGEMTPNPTMNIPARDSSGNLLYNIGDEFECEVAPNTKYHFFILSENEDDTLNLIMDGNVVENTAYVSLSDFTTAGGTLGNVDEDSCNSNGYGCGATTEKGPITAYAKLKEVTDGWSNVPDLTKTYTSSDGANSFTFNGKARMPHRNEIPASSPWWLTLNLGNPRAYYVLESAGVKLFEYDDGNQASYWLMSEFGNDQAGSIDVGNLYVECQGSCAVNHNGVRPVITVQKGHLQ